MTGWVESFEGLTIEATEIIGAGEKVLVGILQRGRPRGSQTMVERRWWQVVTLREGVLARLQTFQRREQALEAAGLSEEAGTQSEEPPEGGSSSCVPELQLPVRSESPEGPTRPLCVRRRLRRWRR